MSDKDEPPEFSDAALEAGRLLFAGPVDFVKGVVALDGLPEADRLEVCFAGRSNVGKSSLINALTGRGKLARSSSEPGRTRELNFFDLAGGQLYLVDLPGFGYARVSRTQAEAWMKLTRKYLSGRPNLRRAFFLVDARRGLMQTDLDIMTMMDKTAVNYQIVLTKADKVKSGALEHVRGNVTDALKKRGAAHPVVRVTSAEKGRGISELRAEIYQLL